MKKRLNILCVLVFVVMAIGTVPFAYALGLGFVMGMEQSGKPVSEIDRMAGAPQLYLMPGHVARVDHATVSNAVDGKAVAVWPESVSVDIAVDYPVWYKPVNIVVQVLGFAAVIAIAVLFLKLIVRVNRGSVFEWRNVRLLRWLGSLELAASIVLTAMQMYGASVVSSQFGVEGFTTDYFSYLSATELSIGLVALIAAEIFAIGLKMKEEQDLTI